MCNIHILPENNPTKMCKNFDFTKKFHRRWLDSGIFGDKTMDDIFMYISNDDKQNHPFFFQVEISLVTK